MPTFRKAKSCSVLGIDIRTTSINILEISNTHGQHCVEGYGHKSLPKNQNDIDAMATCIKVLVANENLLSKQVVLAVPDSSAISKIINISANVLQQDVEEWVFLEAEKHIPYSLNEVSLDFTILGPSASDSEQLDILIVASRTENVDRRVEIIRRAGLDVQIVDVESYAIERAARLWTAKFSLSDHGKYIAMFEIEEMYLRCFVFNGGNIIFSREDALGGIPVLSGYCDLLLQQIKRALQFFSSIFSYGFIDRIVLAGSRATLHNLEQYLQLHLGIPICITNPFNEMTFATDEIRIRVENDAPMLMVACGLALRRW